MNHLHTEYELVTLRTSRERLNSAIETGIYVRAMNDKKWGTFDISQLDGESLWRWLHSRSKMEWPSSVVMHLLGHDITEFEAVLPEDPPASG